MLLYSMPKATFDPECDYSLEVMYEMILEPWFLGNIQVYFQSQFEDGELSEFLCDLTKKAFTRYSLDDAQIKTESQEIQAFMAEAMEWLQAYGKALLTIHIEDKPEPHSMVEQTNLISVKDLVTLCQILLVLIEKFSQKLQLDDDV